MFDPSALLGESAGLPTTTALLSRLSSAEAEAETLRSSGSGAELGAAVVLIGRLRSVLGEVDGTVDALQEAEMLLGPSNLLDVEIGFALCYAGYYTRGKFRFDQLRQREDIDPLAQALCALSLGMRYYKDLRHYDEARRELEQARRLLGPDQPYAEAAARLALAEIHVLCEDRSAAADALQGAGEFLDEMYLFWYRPEWFTLQARLALLEGDIPKVLKLTRQGLGAVGDLGDLRALPALYRTLALALETNSEHLDDARDAHLRALSAARQRAPRLELAQSLEALGQHYKHFYRRTTQRARGAGMLFEADHIYRDLGLATAPRAGG